jgi:Domain of unknown function (DUF4389)
VAYCANCGTQAGEGQRFCVVCGAALAPGQPRADVSPTSGTPQPFGAMPPWSSASENVDGGDSPGPDVVFRYTPGPVTQSRRSILFRLVLAFPLLVWMALLVIAAEFAVIGGWFAAVFTGRVPDGIQEFVSDVLRYSTEVIAYTSVVVPHWPGFTLRAGDTAQISLGITHYRLNRAAVFFRLIVGFPAFVIYYLVGYGGYLLSIAVWVSALILGRPAKPLYSARLLSLRFATRAIAYMALLTPTQPFAGFFGDPADATAPTDEQAGLTSRLHPSTWGRIFFVVAALLGVVLSATNPLNRIHSVNLVNNLVVAPTVRSTNQQAIADVNTFSSNLRTCVAQSNAPCVVNAATTARDAIANEIATLNSVLPFVSHGRIQYVQYTNDLIHINADFSTLSTYQSLAQQQTYILHRLVPDIVALNSGYQQLISAL